MANERPGPCRCVSLALGFAGLRANLWLLLGPVALELPYHTILYIFEISPVAQHDRYIFTHIYTYKNIPGTKMTLVLI